VVVAVEITTAKNLEFFSFFFFHVFSDLF